MNELNTTMESKCRYPSHLQISKPSSILPYLNISKLDFLCRERLESTATLGNGDNYASFNEETRNKLGQFYESLW